MNYLSKRILPKQDTSYSLFAHLVVWFIFVKSKMSEDE